MRVVASPQPPDAGSRAQSESVGVILLTGVFVVLAAIVGGVMISNFVATGEAQPLVDADGNATTRFLTITHAGGETLRTDDVEIVVRGETTKRYSLTSFSQSEGADISRFEPGDRYRHPTEVDGDQLTVLLVHEPSNTVVDRVEMAVVLTVAARFSTSPDRPKQGETITFDASESAASGSSIDTFEWDFDGDGSVDATGQTVQRSYADDGTYPVSLIVTAADGRTATRTEEVQVYNELPTASFTASPLIVAPGESVAFDASGSSDDSGIASYAWDFDDGATATGETTAHSFSGVGNYSVNLAVTDDDGAVDSTTATIRVRQAYFGAAIAGTNSPVTEGETLTVDAEVSNTGAETGTQDVTLSIDGTQTDSQSLTLADGETTTISLDWVTARGDSQPGSYTATVATANASDSTTVSVVEQQAVLQISDVRGLTDQFVPHDYQAAVDVEETNDVETENLAVRLVIEDGAGNEIYNTSDSSLSQIRNRLATASFDVGQLSPGSYTYTVTADAGNAQAATSTGSFVSKGTFGGVTIADLGGNADSTSQTTSFTLQGELSEGESVTIDLSEAQDAGVPKVDYRGATVDVDAGSGSAQFTTLTDSNAVITYEPGASGDADGSTVELTISGVETGPRGQQTDPYTVTFDRSDGDSDTDSFEVTGGGGNPGGGSGGGPPGQR